jgi:HEAT repeat protein
MSRAPAEAGPSARELGRMTEIDEWLALGSAGIAPLMRLLDDPSWTVRRAVVGALAALGPAAAPALCQALQSERHDEARIAAVVDALAGSLGPTTDDLVAALAAHPDPAVAADVAQILGRRRAPGSVPTLIALMRHPDDNVAVGAIEALGRIGGRAAVEALIESLERGSFFRVFPAIQVLGQSADPRAVAPLESLLVHPLYAAEAATALGRSGTPAAAAALARWLRALGQDAPGIRRAALALEAAELEHRAQFGDGEPILRAIREAFGGRPVAPGAEDRWLAAVPGADAGERRALAFLLGLLGSERSVPTLIGFLEGAAEQAEAATTALGRLGRSRDAEAHLARRLLEGDSRLRRVALPLVSRGAAAASQEAIAACLDDVDPEVRALACAALARMGQTAAVGALFQRLADASPRVALAALAAVQSLGGPEALERARAAVVSTEAPRTLRQAALRVLAYFGPPTALSVFLDAIDDGDPRIQQTALQGLAELDDERALEALLVRAAPPTAPRVRAAALRALGHRAVALAAAPPGGARSIPVDPRTRGCLLAAVGDDDAWVRYYACQSIGALGLAEGVPALIARLADPAGQVRVAAVEGLSRLRGPEAVRALRAAVKEGARAPVPDGHAGGDGARDGGRGGGGRHGDGDGDGDDDGDGDVRRAALVGLGLARDLESLPVMFAAAESREPATRLVALSALAACGTPAVLSALERAAANPDPDADVNVRTAAVGLLAAAPEAAATAALVRMLGVPVARALALEALASPGPGRVAGLVAALETADEQLAPDLVAALVRLRRADPAAERSLVAAMFLPNPRARKAVARGLVAVDAPVTQAALVQAAQHDPDPEVRRISFLLLDR